MKPKPTTLSLTAGPVTFDQFVDETAVLVVETNRIVRHGATNAILIGMRLHFIREATAAQFSRNDLLGPGAAKAGFAAALERVMLPRRSAYNCIAYFERTAELLGLDPGARPAPGTEAWSAWEKQISDACAGCTLQRLVTHGAAATSDDARLAEIIRMAEEGNAKAQAALEAIHEGKHSVARAWAGLQGAESTAGKDRRDPVYLDFDVVEKRATGLLPKALVTMRNAFAAWDSYDEAARRAVIREWKETAKLAPADFLRAILPGR